MPQKKQTTPSYLQGREIGRKGGTDFAVAEVQQHVEDIRQEVEAITDFSQIPITSFDRIDPNPFQPRKRQNQAKLQELMQNMRDHGITQAIVGRYHPTIPGRVQIAFGHRRVKAAELAGRFDGYPILIKSLSDTDMRLQSIGENRFREDLTPIDEGYMFKSMIDAGFTQEETAAFYQVSRGYIRERVDLTNDSEDIVEMVIQRPDTVRAARELRKVEDLEIREHTIQTLLLGEISGSQVHIYIRTLEEEKLRQASFLLEDGASIKRDADAPVRKEVSYGDRPQTEEQSTVQEDVLNDESVLSPSVRPRKVIVHDQLFLEQTRMQGASLLEQTRLRTMTRQIVEYSKRLDQRRKMQEDIPQEEITLLDNVCKLVISQLDKLGMMKEQ